jgi:predicted DNA-binding WGR domain protein
LYFVSRHVNVERRTQSFACSHRTVRFGKKGAKGQTKTKTHTNAEKAAEFVSKQIKSKEKKGYKKVVKGEGGEEKQCAGGSGSSSGSMCERLRAQLADLGERLRAATQKRDTTAIRLLMTQRNTLQQALLKEELEGRKEIWQEAEGHFRPWQSRHQKGESSLDKGAHCAVRGLPAQTQQERRHCREVFRAI